MNDTFRRTVRRAGLLAAIVTTTTFLTAPVIAQAIAQTVVPAATSDAMLVLPDAPGFVPSSSSASTPFAPQADSTASKLGVPPSRTTLPEASRTTKYIEPGQVAPKLTAGDKALLGLKDALSPFAAIGWLASAGYEQALNGSPNYGTDRGAFGQRLGAAALRDTSEGVFSDSILAPVLHEDPRYYRMGPGRNFFVRVLYSGTRPIITRTDGGHLTPNFAQLGGNLAGSALTQAYYPQLNRGVTQVMETFGGSIGGSAVGDLVSEFYGDFTHLFHAEHK